ncbi:hypothetical protein FQA39_LY02502 [Lamprigera yunnana]|nr:hypothetical protein FQA39_LY02502 [Lamprigera yunnana]
MLQREGQDPQPGYMDGVCVKISEKYKPPPRINLAVSYAQRLLLNKQVQDIIPYDFHLESSIKHKVRELRNVRKQLLDEKKDRMEKLKEARLRYEKKLLENKKSNEDATAETKDSTGLIENEQIINATAVSTGMIYPTSYSYILTPTPLSNTDTSQTFNGDPNEKSPFNISDFEADTSSPFDNMELKTINDIEELAQVLKKEEASNNTYNAAQLYSNYVPLPSTSTQSVIPSSYNIKPQFPSYMPPLDQSVSTMNNVNGYFYNYDVINPNQNFQPYSYNTRTSNVKETNHFYKNVPDIMKSLESDLDNTHISKNGASTNQNDLVKVRPSRIQESGNEQVIKSIEADDTYDLLPKNLQYLSKGISSMGFPLSRVARACQVLGDDQKKIVEHLLAMSELLDLGFSESDVSKALLQCNNDRDKALDILIS